MNYVLRRTDGKYVTPSGSEHSYTTKLEHARTFNSYDEADGDRCVENEQVVPVSDLLQRPRQ